MADSFNNAIRIEEEMAERDLRLYLRAHNEGRPLPDFQKTHAMLRRLAIKSGQSKKGAQAWATIKIEEMKRHADAK